MADVEQVVFGVDEVGALAKELCKLMAQYRIFAFSGPLGAGKTTMIREMLRECGVKESVKSPTFTLLNVYTDSDGKQFYHFDIYRTQSLDDFMATGFDEYLNSDDGYCFIEWPEAILPLLKDRAVHIELDYCQEGNSRSIALSTL